MGFGLAHRGRGDGREIAGARVELGGVEPVDGSPEGAGHDQSRDSGQRQPRAQGPFRQSVQPGKESPFRGGTILRGDAPPNGVFKSGGQGRAGACLPQPFP